MSCDMRQRWKVMCDISSQKSHRVKVKRKGGFIIDEDEDVQGEPEPKQQMVDPVPVVEIWQPARTSLSLFLDLISMLWDHIVKQQKQTTLLEQIARIQELDQADWVQVGSDGSETGSEASEEEEMEGQGRNGDVNKIDKGKGKERVEDGNVDGRRDRNKGGDGNRRMDGETLQ